MYYRVAIQVDPSPTWNWNSEEVAEPLKTSKMWLLWHQEAQNGRIIARQCLLLLRADA